LLRLAQIIQRLRKRFPLSRQADWAFDIFVYMGMIFVITTVLIIIILQLASSLHWALPTEFFDYGVPFYIFVSISCLAGLFYGSFCTILDDRRSFKTKDKQI
jgi:hypothetical protein